MTMNLIADTFAFREPNGEETSYIGFQNASTKEHCLILFSYNYDEQDIRLGMDCHYVEVNDQAYSLYGGIENVTVNKDILAIHLNEKGSKRLETTTIHITITNCDWSLEKIKHKILSVL